jgi:hypothetical protein
VWPRSSVAWRRASNKLNELTLVIGLLLIRACSDCRTIGVYKRTSWMAGPARCQRGLHRVHWSKEASSLEFAFPNWSIGVKLICHCKQWIVTMVETLIR